MNKVVAALTIALFVVFSAISAGGGYLTYQAMSMHAAEPPANPIAKPDNPKASEEISITFGNIAIKAQAAYGMPGLVILCAGMTGLIMMLNKIPVRKVLGNQSKDGGNRALGLMMQEKIVSEKALSMPLPVWLLLKNTGRYEKISDSSR